MVGLHGRSGKVPIWIAEQIDLSGFAGQSVLSALNNNHGRRDKRPWWALDDISIPELGYQDDVEGGSDGWLAEGFVRTNNLVPRAIWCN